MHAWLQVAYFAYTVVPVLSACSWWQVISLFFIIFLFLTFRKNALDCVDFQ